MQSLMVTFLAGRHHQISSILPEDEGDRQIADARDHR
jgi:hypothetical protein